MKKLFLATFLVATTFGFAQNKSHLQLAKMKGQIKSVDAVDYLVSENGNLEKINNIKTIFNKDGNFTLMSVSNEFVNSNFKNDYDSKGNFLSMQVLDSVGNLRSKTEAKNNEKGQKMEEKILMADGIVFQRVVFSYDDKGRQIEQRICGESDNSCSEKTIFEYDAKGNVIKETRMAILGQRTLDSKEYKYDNKDNRTEFLLYNNHGELMEKTTYTYDANDNLIKESLYDAFGVLEEEKTYSYAYDNRNNWTKRETFVDGQKVSVSEQTLEYY